MPFLEGWDGPSIVTAIVAILGVLGSGGSYWLGRRRAMAERRDDSDRIIASKLFDMMPESDFLDFIGYIRGSHRCKEKALEQFRELLSYLRLNTNHFHRRKLDCARSRFVKSAIELDNFILIRFFDVSSRTLALQPDQNPDRTGDLDQNSPGYIQYFNWVDEMDALAADTLEKYRNLLSAKRQILP